MPSMSMSPDVQAYSQTPGPEQAEALVKQKFTEMAFSVLQAKYPELVPTVVTFKILEVTPEEGSGLGAFIFLVSGSKTLYIPVVMSAGQLKPFDMFYFKDLNVFLPLSRDWLSEISKMAVDSMGEDVKDPEHAQGNVNLRDLVYPPTLATGGGRHVLASAEPEVTDIVRMYKEAQDTKVVGVGDASLFLDFVRKAPAAVAGGIKLAVEKNPDLLQQFAKHYGVKEVIAAMRDGLGNTVKTASERPRIAVFTRDSRPEDFQQEFGEKTAQVVQSVIRDGIYIKDTRRYTPGQIDKVAANYDETSALQAPSGSAGWYRLYFADRPPAVYYVIPFPHNEEGEQQSEYNNSEDVQSSRSIDRVSTGNEQKRPVQYVAIQSDLQEAWTSKDLLGEPIVSTKEVEGTPLYQALIGAKKYTPKSDGKGLFVATSDRGVKGTVPLHISTTVDEGDGFKHYHLDMHPTKFVQGDVGRQRFSYRKGALGQAETVVLVPDNAVWIPVDRIYRTPLSLFKDPKHVRLWVHEKIREIGGEVPKVACDNDNAMWRVDGTPCDYIDALTKVAVDYGVSTPTAQQLLKEAADHGRAVSTLLPIKIAQPTGMMPPSEQQAMAAQGPAGGGQGMAAQGPMGGEQAMGMPPQPQAVTSPTELAIGEAVSQLQQQLQQQQLQAQAQMQQVQAQLQTSQQMTEQLAGLLQGIQQRSQQIEQATGGALPPEADGADPAVMAQTLAPPQPTPPPMPVMDTESPTPEMIAAQINPELAEQADALDNARVFDTAAIGMLANTPLVQEMVSNYVPNLERAVDNLGRILLSMWSKETEVKEAVGDENYATLEDKTRTVFKGLGDVILTLNKSAVTSQNADEQQEPVQTGMV